MTVQEYLTSEERSTVRREYIDGQVFAMSGVTNRHNIIALNIYSVLRAHLRGSRCRAYVSEVKVQIESMNSFYYPDVMVSCEAYDRKTVYCSRPLLLVEVLSRSTAVIDRREKVIAYRQLPSLQEYLIVHQLKQNAELHRRIKTDKWEIFNFSRGDNICLNSVPGGPVDLGLNAIYEDATLDSDNEWQVHEEGSDNEAEYGGLDW